MLRFCGFWSGNAPWGFCDALGPRSKKKRKVAAMKETASVGKLNILEDTL